MTNDDLKQHSLAWQYAADYFRDLEERTRGGSQGEMSMHQRRLCEAVANGYLVQAGEQT